MSIATIVTGGYGNGTFDTTIAEVTLMGFGIGDAAETGDGPSLGVSSLIELTVGSASEIELTVGKG